MSDAINLIEVCSLITKGTTPTAQDGGFLDKGINYIKSESLSYHGSIDRTAFCFISASTHDKLRRSKIKNRDILYSIAGANLGKCGIVSEEILPANTNQAVAIIRVDQRRASPEFVSYVLRNKAFVQMVLSGVAQSAQPNVNLGDIGRFKIPAWPLHYQQAVASVLGALDDKIDLNRRISETLESIARAIFKDWFVDFGPIRAKQDRRTPYLASDLWSLFPDRFDDEGRPKGWHAVPLLEIASLLSGGTPATAEPAYWDGNIPWASAKDVSQCGELFLLDTIRTITQRGLAESSTRMIPKLSTVVVARGATTGRFSILGRDMAMNQTCYALSSKTGRPFLLNCIFASLINSIVHGAHGSVFDTITTKTIDGAAAIIPGEDILDRFEELVGPLFTRALVSIEECQSLAQTRELLLPKLLSGEIRVNDAEKIAGETI